MREMVAKEIAAFRERSNRRDMERLRREEEIERQERERNHPRINRLAASPPPSAPSGPSGGANAVPISNSRLTASTRIPTGPSSTSNAVKFVNGTSTVTQSVQKTPSYWTKEEEDSSASDSELENRRAKNRSAEIEKQYLDAERRWLNRERSRTSALEREKQRDDDDLRRQAADAETMKKRLEEWDDDAEAEKRAEDYYRDKSLWIRTRTSFRQREKDMDERDRAAEAREVAASSTAEGDKKRTARTMADEFLEQQAKELDLSQQPREPQKFKLTLTSAPKPSSAATSTRRLKTSAEIENLLEDEDDDTARKKRVLIPIQYDPAADKGMDEETRERAVRDLAKEIPTDREGLFKWPVAWEFVDEQMVEEKLHPFVEKKIVEYLGVCEGELVRFVVEHIRKRAGAEDLVKELEMVGIPDYEGVMCVLT